MKTGQTRPAFSKTYFDSSIHCYCFGSDPRNITFIASSFDIVVSIVKLKLQISFIEDGIHSTRIRDGHFLVAIILPVIVDNYSFQRLFIFRKLFVNLNTEVINTAVKSAFS